MAEKVKVSREVAEALESAREIRSDETITNMCIARSFVADQEPLNKLNPYIMVKILINGYEVEQTPEELVREYYRFKEMDLKQVTNSYDRGFATGALISIKKTLDMLGVKIKGINT
ncbi:hypothetical protein [Cytobacillus horneckiae]|uniref:hypothetical protein n=1 Tax=Cytobacillus horneckiae TaxID=549687 RepID=UPI003D9A1821